MAPWSETPVKVAPPRSSGCASLDNCRPLESTKVAYERSRFFQNAGGSFAIESSVFLKLLWQPSELMKREFVKSTCVRSLGCFGSAPEKSTHDKVVPKSLAPARFASFIFTLSNTLPEKSIPERSHPWSWARMRSQC